MIDVLNISKKTRNNKIIFRDCNVIVEGVYFSIKKGEMVGLVGRSGSGKSTVAKIVSGIIRPDEGLVLLNKKNINDKRNRRKYMGFVFQDYKESINPSMRVYEAVSEPLLLEGYLPNAFVKEMVVGVIDRVGLPSDFLYKYIHELSGGQIQRVCIARAIINKPSVVIFDEAISSLDILNKINVIDILRSLNKEFGMSFLFISHDIELLCLLCKKILFLDRKIIVEEVSVENLSNVTDDFSKQILKSVI